MKAKVSQNQLASFVFVAVFVGVGVNILSNRVPGNISIFATIGALLAILTCLVPHDGLLRRSRYGGSRLVKILAVALLAAYPLVAWLTVGKSGLGAAIMSVSCLWLAASLLLWDKHTGRF